MPVGLAFRGTSANILGPGVLICETGMRTEHDTAGRHQQDSSGPHFLPPLDLCVTGAVPPRASPATQAFFQVNHHYGAHLVGSRRDVLSVRIPRTWRPGDPLIMPCDAKHFSA